MSITAHPEALTVMRERATPDCRWAAYSNMAFDSTNFGHLQFLMVGPMCTHATPPAHYPVDTGLGAGWRFLLVGIVNLETGKVEKETAS